MALNTVNFDRNIQFSFNNSHFLEIVVSFKASDFSDQSKQ